MRVWRGRRRRVVVGYEEGGNEKGRETDLGFESEWRESEREAGVGVMKLFKVIGHLSLSLPLSRVEAQLFLHSPR